MTSLSQRLRALRHDAAQFIDDVAAGARLHAGLVRSVEAGRVASDGVVAALARHFGMTADTLTGSEFSFGLARTAVRRRREEERQAEDEAALARLGM